MLTNFICSTFFKHVFFFCFKYVRTFSPKKRNIVKIYAALQYCHQKKKKKNRVKQEKKKLFTFLTRFKLFVFRLYKVAQETLRCYLKSTNYTLVLVDLNTDKKVNTDCRHNEVSFKTVLILEIIIAYLLWLFWGYIFILPTFLVICYQKGKKNSCKSTYAAKKIFLILNLCLNYLFGLFHN